MIEKIGHYSLTNPGTIYDEEAMTVLELAGRTAEKVNEAIEQVNKNEQTVQEAEDYMVKSLPEFVDRKIEEMAEDGTLDTKLVSAVSSDKVDKGGVGQVTYSMLAQDVREAMTGGSTPVVGVNSVGTDNIVNLAVNEEKLAYKNRHVSFYYPDVNGYRKPLIQIDTTNKTAVLNPDFTADFEFITPLKRFPVSIANCTVAYEKTSTGISCELYFNPETFVFYVCNLHTGSSDYHPECIYLGFIATSYVLATNTVPVSVDGIFYPVNENESGKRVQGFLIWYSGDYYSREGTGRVAKWDMVNKKIILPKASYYAVVSGNGFEQLTLEDVNDSGEYELTYTGSGWSYIYGGVEGISIVEYNNVNRYHTGWPLSSGRYLLGMFNHSSGECHFNFPCVKTKTVSILGDSVSTFAGYIPADNVAHYKGNNGGVSNVHETWWGRVIDSCGLTLNTNNSYSGSQVTKHATVPSGLERAGALDNGTDPDIILIFLGYNDFNRDVQLGTYDGKGAIAVNTSTFREAYAYMLQTVQTNYPNAKLYCLTLPDCERHGDLVSPEANGNGVYLTEFNHAIREICEALCVEVIETAYCGMHKHNGSTYGGDYSDGRYLHPNRKGHELIGRKVKQAIADAYL